MGKYIFLFKSFMFFLGLINGSNQLWVSIFFYFSIFYFFLGLINWVSRLWVSMSVVSGCDGEGRRSKG